MSKPIRARRGSAAWLAGTTLQDAEFGWENDNNDLYVGTGSGNQKIGGATGPCALGGLTDVTISAVADGEIIQWDSGSSAWINQTLSELVLDGLQIHYVAGSDAAAEYDATFVSLDVSSLDASSEVHAMHVSLVGTLAGGAAALGIEPGIDPIHQHVGTLASPGANYAGRLTSGPTYTDNVDGQSIWVADDDGISIGSSTVFDELELIFSTNTTFDAQLTFWYYDSTPQWVEFHPTDTTEGGQYDGTIDWDSDNLANWSSEDPWSASADTGYWIKITRTRTGTVGSPALTTAKLLAATEYMWDSSGDLSVNAGTFSGKIVAGTFASPLDVTATRQHGFEIHFSGNNYDVTGIRSRAQLITTDTTATAQGALLQAANNDNINAGVLQGALIEAIGKATTNAATISTMRGALINTEWDAKDTITDLRVLHVRTHTRDAATEGYFSNSGYGIYIENEAVGGNGQALTAGIYFKDTNISGGNSAFVNGIDFSGATYSSPEIKLLSGGTIGAGGSLAIDGSGNTTLAGTLSMSDKDVTDVLSLAYQAAAELTISGGVVTVTQANHTIDTASDDASDDLDTINGGTAGEIIYLRAEHADRTVVLKDGTGNLELAGADFTLDDTDQVAALKYDGALSKWLLIGSTPGVGGGDLLADGSVPLTANWDVGAYTITGLTFTSDQATGTAPFTVASTTVVTNLNADTVDGVEAAAIIQADGSVNFSGAQSFGDQDVTDVLSLAYQAAAELTINAGVVTVTQAIHRIDTASDDATDDLDTINGGTDGEVIYLRAEHADRTVVLKHGSGNLELAGADFTLDDTDQAVALCYDGTLSKWLLVGATPSAGAGDLLADGSVPLTANWDVGAYTITALRFISDQATGTSPFDVSSVTVVTNLNADLLDGNEAAAFILASGATSLTGAWDAGSHAITATQFISDIAGGTAPFGCTSTTVVPNLNVDQVDGKDSTDFLLLDGSQGMAGHLDFSGGAYDILIKDNEAAALEVKEGANAYLTFVTTDGGEYVTLGKKLTAGSFASPMDVTATREHGVELHFSGNNYSVTALRARAHLVTTDTAATAQGALLQAANNDNINAGVLQGALIEAIGKATTNAATISTMRGALVNTEWDAKDTITDLRVLHVRTHTRDAATEGYFSNSGYGIYLENEAVGGNGQALTAGLYFKGTNLSGGNSAFVNGIDFSGATYSSPEIKLLSGGTIGAGGSLAIDGSGNVTIDAALYVKKTVVVQVLGASDALATGDGFDSGDAYFSVPLELNGWNLTNADVCIYTVSSSGLPSFQIHNLTHTADMLSTNITIDESEFNSYDPATPAVIDTAEDDVATGDRLRFDCDGAGTDVTGAEFHLVFTKP